MTRERSGEGVVIFTPFFTTESAALVSPGDNDDDDGTIDDDDDGDHHRACVSSNGWTYGKWQRRVKSARKFLVNDTTLLYITYERTRNRSEWEKTIVVAQGTGYHR